MPTNELDQPKPEQALSRRGFLKMAGLGLGALAFRLPPDPASVLNGQNFPNAERLGRIVAAKSELKARPDYDSKTLKTLNEDDVVVWLRELTGSRKLWNSQRFVETPDGFLYAANVQPVLNRPNEPLKQFPSADGMWVEVTVPYADLRLANPPARSPWVKSASTPRLYYSQILWADQIKSDESGRVLYRTADRYGNPGDFFWAEASAFRPLTADDFAPIHPEADDKRVLVNLTHQTMSCFEGNQEVFFTRVSTGGKWDAAGGASDKWATPVGTHSIWRKLAGVHMQGGSTGGGYDLAGIGWTTLFSTNGVAVHSTFWHNNFGIPMSHGCVNARPEDAQWVFRWTLPEVSSASGDVSVAGGVSTKVTVVEG
jgi:hypothetical protein